MTPECSRGLGVKTATMNRNVHGWNPDGNLSPSFPVISLYYRYLIKHNMPTKEKWKSKE